MYQVKSSQAEGEGEGEGMPQACRPGIMITRFCLVSNKRLVMQYVFPSFLYTFFHLINGATSISWTHICFSRDNVQRD